MSTRITTDHNDNDQVWGLKKYKYVNGSLLRGEISIPAALEDSDPERLREKFWQGFDRRQLPKLTAYETTARKLSTLTPSSECIKYPETVGGSGRPGMFGMTREDYSRQLAKAQAEIQRYEMPRDVIDSAKKVARRLTNLFENGLQYGSIGDQLSGRIDSRKLAVLNKAVYANTYSREELRPFARAQQQPTSVPTIAIVARASEYAMRNYPGFIPLVTATSLGIAWAARTAGFNVSATLTSRIRGDNMDEHMTAIELVGHGANTPYQCYAPFMNERLYEFCWFNSMDSDWQMHQNMLSLFGRSDDTGARGWFRSATGSYALQYVQQKYSPNVIICMGGSLLDDELADIELKFDNNAARSIASNEMIDSLLGSLEANKDKLFGNR